MRNINYSFLPDGTLPLSKLVLVSKDTPVETSDVDRLVRLVYSPDPRTKLPCSDLSVLVSDSVPRDIADFVRNQLMNPIADVVSSIKNGQQVDDDTLFALTRNINEDNRSYINRVDNYLRSINKSSEDN